MHPSPFSNVSVINPKPSNALTPPPTSKFVAPPMGPGYISFYLFAIPIILVYCRNYLPKFFEIIIKNYFLN